MGGGFWTAQQIDELKVRWIQGDSASIIGAQMNFTRNAILGKVYRLGLQSRIVVTSKPWKLPERPPRRRVERAPPKILTMVSPLTGIFISAPPRRQNQPEYTKNELRAQLTQAVINTAGMG